MTRPDYAAEVVDRIAIYDLYARYVHALDDHDWAALDELFVPETTMDWTSSGHIRGEYARDVRPEYERNAGLFFLDIHYCTNIRIDFEPGLQAASVKSKTLNVAGMRTPDNEAKMAQVHGEYSDRLEKRDGEWKIIDRYWHHQGVTLGAQLAEGTGGMLGN
ncbi:MAG TPA: nuclear transport factor 2 family protein [Microbacteriaceae bacterium]|nr:nuclear transport factor 2 family protein [Microbacteriaceae bacterium]